LGKFEEKKNLIKGVIFKTQMNLAKARPVKLCGKREKKIIVNNSLSIITVTKFEEEKNTIKRCNFQNTNELCKNQSTLIMWKEKEDRRQ
jgi:predicted metal-dependent TIM-barrel fold hydrolase